MEGIRMVDLAGQYNRIKPEIDQAIQQVLHSTNFIQGPEVQTFAANLAHYIGTSHVVPCANGTDALQVAMMAAGLKPGDEVILPVHTYVATAEVIALLGLVPVFVDVERDTFNIDVGKVEQRITKKTKAIVPVHLYGQCANMAPLLELGIKHNLMVIEDAAQSLGAVYTNSNGKKQGSGTIAAIGTTSFFPSKNLGCYGDGGAIMTNDATMAESLRMIANHGQRVKYYHDVIGVNSRLDTIQAAILNVKLKYLPEYESKRIAVANYYDKALGEMEGVVTPFRAGYSSHVFHQYTLKVERRDKLKQQLEKDKIPSMIYYPVPLHMQKAYQRSEYPEGTFPVAEALSKEVISIPIHTEMTEAQLDYICSKIIAFYRG